MVYALILWKWGLELLKDKFRQFLWASHKSGELSFYYLFRLILAAH